MTSSALLDCKNDWYVNMDRGVCNLFFLFLDVQKAFGTVDHERRGHKQSIEINQSEIDNLKGMFPERSSEFAASVIVFSDWFIV